MPLATAQRSPRIRKGFVFASRKSGLLSSVTPASPRIDVLKRRPPCGSAFFYPRKRAVAGNTRHKYTLGATPFRAPFSYSLDKAAGKLVTELLEKRAKKTPRHRLGRLSRDKTRITRLFSCPCSTALSAAAGESKPRCPPARQCQQSSATGLSGREARTRR